MKNTDLYKIAKVFKNWKVNHEMAADIFDELADNLIDDKEVKTWFYNQAGIISPENIDENCIS